MAQQKAISSLMTENRTFPPPDTIKTVAYVSNMAQYQKMWDQSIKDPDKFWLEQAESLTWFKKPTKSLEYTWDTRNRKIEHTWFADGQLNVSYNCLDRHLGTPTAKKTALIWQGEADDAVRKYTYEQLHKEVCKFANVLKSKGVEQGRPRGDLHADDSGTAHCHAGLHPYRRHSLDRLRRLQRRSPRRTHQRLRVQDAGHRERLAARRQAHPAEGHRRRSPEENARPSRNRIVVKVTDDPCPMQAGRDLWYHEEMAKAKDQCEAEKMNAEDPLFILYTSGSTGKPKGVVHTTGGYLLHVAFSHKVIFDVHDNDIYWCTADIGWVTGHSYIVYGPLANGATSLMFEGVPTYPDAGRFWQVCDKFGVTVFYTAPTAIRSLMRLGDEWPAKYKLDSLRVLGSVGEPINPEAWIWYHKNIGHERCPIVDTWWQTETGGILITPLPGAMTLKPGSATRPFFGVDPVVLRDDGSLCDRNEGGKLCIRRPWPGIMRTMWGDHDRFIDTYFTMFADHVLHRRRLPHRSGRRLLADGPHRRRRQRLRPPDRNRRGGERPGQPSQGGRGGRHAHAARDQGTGALCLRHRQRRRRGKRGPQEGTRCSTCARKSARSPYRK